MKKVSLFLMALLYLLAGINHFISTPLYLKIMPPWLPFPLQGVYLSGICEGVFGLLLIPVSTRRVAAWLIIALLVAIFPANIQMMLNYSREHNPHLWVTIVRLPLQLLLIRWAYVYTKRPAHGARPTRLDPPPAK